MYLYGASGHAKVIIEILEKQGIKIQGLFDDNLDIKGLLNYAVLGSPEPNKPIEEEVIVSIGFNPIRKQIVEKYRFNYGKAIHLNAEISTRSTIGEGSVVMGNTIINSGVEIGKHVIINTSASIDHDCIIEDFVHISPNATLCGDVFVGEGTHVGAGAVIIPGVKIGKWTVVGAGSVIIKDVPDFATVVGNPGRVVKVAEKT
jgi:sugar O-acyltransferase (sialic acid O-acetyltransferase NeuD family)